MNFKIIFFVFIAINSQDLEFKKQFKAALDTNDKTAASEVLKEMQKAGNRALLNLFSNMYEKKWGSTITDLAIAHIECQTTDTDLSKKISDLNKQVESLIKLAKDAGLIE